jgi:hypothetical protein
MTPAAPAPSASLIRYSRSDFDAYMRLHLHAFIAEHAADLQGHEVDETQALNDLYDLVHGQSQLDWTIPDRNVDIAGGAEALPPPCVIAVVGVAVGCVALVLQAAGVPSSVSRAVGTTVVDEAIAASPAVFNTLEAEVTALMQADGIYNQAKAIFSLFGSIGNVVPIGKIISAIKNELSWYQWMLMGVVIAAQLTLWFTTGGTAAIAELVLFGAAIAGLVVSAAQAYHTCHPSADGLAFHAASLAPATVGDIQPGPFVLLDVAGAPNAMLASGEVYARNADGTWTDQATKVTDFATQLPSTEWPQGALWMIAPNGDADGEIFAYFPGTGQPPFDTKAAASVITAADDGDAWAIRADRSVIRWDVANRTWLPQNFTADQIVPSNVDLVWALVLGGTGGDSTFVLEWTSQTKTWNEIASSPEATDILQLATNSAGDLVCVTTDNRIFEYVAEGSTWIQLGGDDIAAQSICIRDVNNAWLIDVDGMVHALGPIVRPPENPRIVQWDTEDVWDETKSTHLYIVNRGAELVGTCANPAFQDFVNQQIQPMTGKAQAGQFRTGLCQGLYDADFLPAYNNPNFVGQATWKSHFYDSSTGTNYMGEKQPTALTNGATFLQESVNLLHTSDLYHAGYNLGLALHYFTDLTQPMHAANYTYLDSLPFGYHTDFEGYAMSMQAKVVQPIVTGFQPGSVTDVGQLYQQTSAHFKTAYFDTIDKAHKYFTWKIYPATWQQAVLPLLPIIFNEAVNATAQLLYLYMGLALRDSISLDDTVGAGAGRGD